MIEAMCPGLAAFRAGKELKHEGAFTDTVNPSTVALRAGRKVLFDSEQMKITNDRGANRYLFREYRKGWEL